MPCTILTRAMAGPKPFQSAAAPSAAMVLRAQSMKPEYVPEGADCILDLITCKEGIEFIGSCQSSQEDSRQEEWQWTT